MGLAWAAATAERDDGGVGVGQSVLGLGRLSPSRVGVAWVVSPLYLSHSLSRLSISVSLLFIFPSSFNFLRWVYC